jgi:magnesium chelatase subunit D
VFDADEHVCIADVDLARLRARRHGGGNRRGGDTSSRRGAHVRSVAPLPGERSFELDLAATLRAAAIAPVRSAPRITSAHLRKKLRSQPARALVVLVVDASDSMGAEDRMAAAKGAALSLLLTAYRRRDRVAVVVFGGDEATVLLGPTASTGLARQRLQHLPIGGATPLADALLKAWTILRNERRKHPALDGRIVLLSDGRANVALRPTHDVFSELAVLGERIRRDKIASVVIDSSRGGAPELVKVAAALGTSVTRVARLSAGRLVTALRR